jgi:hypothetical protein
MPLHQIPVAGIADEVHPFALLKIVHPADVCSAFFVQNSNTGEKQRRSLR